MPRPRLAPADAENVGGNFEPELLKVLRRVRAEEPLLGLKEYTDRVREKLQLRPLPGVCELGSRLICGIDSPELRAAACNAVVQGHAVTTQDLEQEDDPAAQDAAFVRRQDLGTLPAVFEAGDVF